MVIAYIIFVFALVLIMLVALGFWREWVDLYEEIKERVKKMLRKKRD